MNVIHRDLNPENILITDRNISSFPNIKICDFWSAIIAEKSVIQLKFGGSLLYITPEVINKNYNEKSDIWYVV